MDINFNGIHIEGVKAMPVTKDTILIEVSFKSVMLIQVEKSGRVNIDVKVDGQITHYVFSDVINANQAINMCLNKAQSLC